MATVTKLNRVKYGGCSLSLSFPESWKFLEFLEILILELIINFMANQKIHLIAWKVFYKNFNILSQFFTSLGKFSLHRVTEKWTINVAICHTGDPTTKNQTQTPNANRNSFLLVNVLAWRTAFGLNMLFRDRKTTCDDDDDDGGVERRTSG